MTLPDRTNNDAADTDIPSGGTAGAGADGEAAGSATSSGGTGGSAGAAATGGDPAGLGGSVADGGARWNAILIKFIDAH